MRTLLLNWWEYWHRPSAMWGTLSLKWFIPFLQRMLKGRQKPEGIDNMAKVSQTQPVAIIQQVSNQLCKVRNTNAGTSISSSPKYLKTSCFFCPDGERFDIYSHRFPPNIFQPGKTSSCFNLEIKAFNRCMVIQTNTDYFEDIQNTSLNNAKVWPSGVGLKQKGSIVPVDAHDRNMEICFTLILLLVQPV